MTASKPAPEHQEHTRPKIQTRKIQASKIQTRKMQARKMQARKMQARIWAGGLFAGLYGAAVMASIWAATSMLAIQTEERRAQFQGEHYPSADEVYGPMILMVLAGLPLIWAWWALWPARFSGGGLKRSLALGLVAMLVSAIVPGLVTLGKALILVPFMGLTLWPMVALVVSLTLWLSDKLWGSTHP